MKIPLWIFTGVTRSEPEDILKQPKDEPLGNYLLVGHNISLRHTYHVPFPYILNFMILVLPDSFEWLRNLSIFYHFQPNDIIASGALNGTAVAVYSFVIVFSFAAALYIFQRRDLTV